MFSKEYTVVICLVLTLGTVLQLAGFASPGWDISDFDGLYQSNGLWFGVTCWKGKCKTMSYYEQHLVDETSISDVNYASQVGHQVIASLSVTAAVIAWILSLVTIATRDRAVVLTFFNLIFTVISGALIWSIIGVISGITVARARSFTTTSYSFPYSLFLSAIGSVLCLGCAFIHIIKMTPIMTSVKQPYQALTSKI